MKKILFLLSIVLVFTACGERTEQNNTAKEEQKHTEENQAHLNEVQPAPDVTWSLERDNLIKRFKLQNDRSVMMYMYVFIEGVGTPIGYYLVNKVSSVNSQLTNPEQLVRPNSGGISGDSRYTRYNLPSPAEDGSYGTNGDAVFGFTPDGLYMEHNLKYITSTAPLAFVDVPQIGKISIEIADELRAKLDAIEKEAYGK